MIPTFGRRRLVVARRGMRGLGQGSYAACAASCASSPAGMAYCLQNCQEYAQSAGLSMTAPAVPATAIVPTLPTTRVGWRNRRTAAGYHPLATQGVVAAAQNPGMVVSSPVNVSSVAPSIGGEYFGSQFVPTRSRATGNPGTIIRASSLSVAQQAAVQMGWNPASVTDLGSVANPLPGMTMGYPGSSDHWYQLRQF